MADSKMSESDIDFNDSVTQSGRSNPTSDDDMFDKLMRVPIHLPRFLMPESCQDETEAIEHMMHCLNRRYENFPTFFVGKLEEALRDAVKVQQIDQRSPLLIYVNNEKCVFTNFFFTQIFCRAKTVEYLAENYLLWIWDVTLPNNCKKLNETFKRVFPQVNNQILFKSDDLDQYPLFIGVYRNVNGENCYDRLMGGSLQDWKVDDFVDALERFKQKFLRSERDLEERRESIKREAEIKAARMRRTNFGRYHSIHLQANNPKNYRSHLSHDHSVILTDPISTANMEEHLDAFEQFKAHILRFEHTKTFPEEADDEDDDPEQTPTNERLGPVFPSTKKTET